MRIFATKEASVATERTSVCATPPHAIDERVDTAAIALSPSFLAELRKLASRRRRIRLRHVVATTLLVVAGALAKDRSTRAFAVDKGRSLAQRALHRDHVQPPTITAAEAPAPQPHASATSTPEIVMPVQEVRPTASVDAAATPTKKARHGPRHALRHP